MKKHLIFAAALVAAVTFSSCGGNSKSAAPAADSTEVTTDTASAQAGAQALSPETQKTYDALTAQVSQAVDKKDPKAVQTALANIAATYKALVNAGKLDEAKSYGSAVKDFVTKHATELKNLANADKTAATTTISDLVTGIENLPTAANTTAEEAKAAVTQDVVNLASPYLQKGAAAAATAETAANAIKNAPEAIKSAANTAASNAASTAETAAKTAVNNAEAAGKAAVDKQVDKAQKKASDEVNKAQKKANDAVNKAANKALKGIGL